MLGWRGQRFLGLIHTIFFALACSHQLLKKDSFLLLVYVEVYFTTVDRRVFRHSLITLGQPGFLRGFVWVLNIVLRKTKKQFDKAAASGLSVKWIPKLAHTNAKIFHLVNPLNLIQ